ncbi:MAG: oligosaccharide flippase family protein [Acidobacteria bacterium]|nr:oligosaccharide flippase family protein [Acidobacteriota bacterium]
MADEANSTGRSVARNIIYSSTTWLLPVLLSFLATPVIVRALGNEDYGIYALISGFIAYSFNFNIGRALTKYIAEYRAAGENEKIRDIISATLFVNLTIGGIGLLAIVLSADFLVDSVFRIEAAARAKSVEAFYVSALIIFFTMLNQVFNAILQGIQRYDVYSKIFNFYNILLIGGNLALAFAGFKLLGLLWWNLIVTFPTGFLLFRTARRYLPEFGIGFGFGRHTVWKVIGYSWAVVAYQILANVLLLFERTWITRYLGTESLTYYVVPMMIAVYMQSFISSLMLVVFPLASELQQERGKLLRLYLKATKTVAFLVVFMVLSLAIESRQFLTLWMGENFAANSTDLLVIHSLAFGLSALCIISWYLADGLGHPNYNCLIFVVCFIICAAGFILWGDQNNRIALARLAGFGTMFFSVFYVEKWFFGKVQIGFWLRLTGVLGLAAVGAGLVEFLLATVLPVKWPSLVGSVAAGGLVYLGILWAAGFIDEEEKALFYRLIGKNIE